MKLLERQTGLRHPDQIANCVCACVCSVIYTILWLCSSVLPFIYACVWGLCLNVSFWLLSVHVQFFAWYVFVHLCVFVCVCHSLFLCLWMISASVCSLNFEILVTEVRDSCCVCFSVVFIVVLIDSWFVTVSKCFQMMWNVAALSVSLYISGLWTVVLPNDWIMKKLDTALKCWHEGNGNELIVKVVTNPQIRVTSFMYCVPMDVLIELVNWSELLAVYPGGQVRHCNNNNKKNHAVKTACSS